MPHYRNKMNYPILNKQKFWKKNSYEKKFSQGELLILGKYIPHGTAPKKYGIPRWACLVRASL